MADENVNERLKRRSSILKIKGAENGDGSPPASRRVSFADNMKIKTFDETGCNTSEIVPYPTDQSGVCEMSLVNSTGPGEKRVILNFYYSSSYNACILRYSGSTVNMEISVFEKASPVLANDKKEITKQALTRAIASPSPNDGCAKVSSESDSDSDNDDDVTSDILGGGRAEGTGSRLAAVDRSERDTPDGNDTGDVLQLLTNGGRVKPCEKAERGAIASQLCEKSADSEHAYGSGNGLDKLTVQFEQLRKFRLATDAQFERIEKLALEIEKDADEFIKSIKGRPHLVPF